MILKISSFHFLLRILGNYSSDLALSFASRQLPLLPPAFHSFHSHLFCFIALSTISFHQQLSWCLIGPLVHPHTWSETSRRYSCRHGHLSSNICAKFLFNFQILHLGTTGILTSDLIISLHALPGIHHSRSTNIPIQAPSYL